MHIVQFGSYVMPAEQLDMSESQGASRRGATQALGGAGGSLDANGVGPDPLAEDTINKAFIIEATPATLQAAIDNFSGKMMLSENDWRQGARLLIAELPDGSKRATWAKCTEARAMMEWYNEGAGWLPVQATFRRSWPVWWSYADIIHFGDHLGTFEDTAASTFAPKTSQSVVASPTTFTITNGGNSQVTAILIEIAGQITNPRVENLTNKHWYQWVGTLAAGDRLTVKSASFEAKKNGAADWENIILGSDRGQLLPMVLEPGANNFRVTGSGTINCTVRVYWAQCWM